MTGITVGFDGSQGALGSRGIGPVQRWLLGSVGSAVLLQAQCPVVVVPHG